MPILDLISFILNLINAVVVPFIFTIAFLVFIWGIFQAFIAGDDKKRTEGRKLAVYGIIGFFLMVSVWGLVNILVGTFGFGGQRRPPLPSFGSPSPGINSGSFGDSASDEGGLPLGASCPSRADADCASGECDSDGPGQPWVCVPQRTN